VTTPTKHTDTRRATDGRRTDRLEMGNGRRPCRPAGKRRWRPGLRQRVHIRSLRRVRHTPQAN
jgi:hypothetical protein